jgi:dTDP-4-dehydrorhamnose 3,5-epimerase-like enzyme
MKNGNNKHTLSTTPKLREPHKMRKTRLSYMITLPKIEDEGFLCFAEGNNHLPFSVKRFYYIADVVEGAKRGFHAHHETRQVLFCIKGSITIVLDNGQEREKVILDQSNKGIFLDKMMWHEMEDFTEDTVLLVAASEYYDEKDYIRDYKKFSTLASKKVSRRSVQV